MKKTTQYWGVSTKFFDSGKVKTNIFPVEAATKPESTMEENRMCDEYGTSSIPLRKRRRGRTKLAERDRKEGPR